MASKVGKLIKEARTEAGLTQAELAKKVGSSITAGDISQAERGEMELTQAQLKKIAKICGVTQASLLNAAKGATTKKTAATKKSTAEKKPKTPSNANTSMKVTSTEKKLIEYYRLANSDTKKAATRVLKGECSDMIMALLGGDGAADTVADMLGDVLGNLFGK